MTHRQAGSPSPNPCHSRSQATRSLHLRNASQDRKYQTTLNRTITLNLHCLWSALSSPDTLVPTSLRVAYSSASSSPVLNPTVSDTLPRRNVPVTYILQEYVPPVTVTEVRSIRWAKLANRRLVVSPVYGSVRERVIVYVPGTYTLRICGTHNERECSKHDPVPLFRMCFQPLTTCFQIHDKTYLVCLCRCAAPVQSMKGVPLHI